MSDNSSKNIISRLHDGEIIPMHTADWEAMAADFKLVKNFAAGLSGDILLVRRALPADKRRQGWAIVEKSKPGERVIRPLKNEKEARALIADRLAAYERMWDG